MRRRHALKAMAAALLAPLGICQGQAPVPSVVSPKRLWEAREQERAECDYRLRIVNETASNVNVAYDPATHTIRIW